MNELREDLDRALRALPVGEAPAERARRAGRRLRTRRRLGAAAGVLAVAAVAAGYPALARGTASAPAPASTTAPGHGPVLTDRPPPGVSRAPGGLADTAGVIAQGTVGAATWRVTAGIPGAPGVSPPRGDCYAVTVSPPSHSPQAQCGELPGDPGSVPALFTASGQAGTGASVAAVAGDVAFIDVTFDDGQQLKLIPVTAHGHRYVAWVAPESMTVISVIAHLGGPYSDTGELVSATPFDLPGQLPLFTGLWQQEGQGAPPPDTRVIGHGTAGGRAWTVTAYEGQWGTCFVARPPVGSSCEPAPGVTGTTRMLGGWASPAVYYGAAARNVAALHITLSTGTVITVRPVGVGVQNLFAFPGVAAAPVSYAGYDVAGHRVASGKLTGGIFVLPGGTSSGSAAGG